MAINLQPLFATEDDVPESQTVTISRDDYALNETTGRYELQVTEANGFAFEDVSGMRTTLEKFKTDNKSLTTNGKAFAGLGRTVEEIQTALAELDTLKATGGNVDEQVRSVTAQLEAVKKAQTEEIVKATDPFKRQLGMAHEQLGGALKTAKLTAAITEADGSIDLLLPMLERETKADVADDGTMRVFIINPDDGTERVGKNLEPMTFRELVVEKKADDKFSRAFNANGHSGGGGENNDQAGGTLTTGKITPEQAGSLSMSEYRKARTGGQV
jgi:hypothetical protein